MRNEKDALPGFPDWLRFFILLSILFAPLLFRAVFYPELTRIWEFLSPPGIILFCLALPALKPGFGLLFLFSWSFFGLIQFGTLVYDVCGAVSGVNLNLTMLPNCDLRAGFFLFGRWILYGLLFFTGTFLLAGLCLFRRKNTPVRSFRNLAAQLTVGFLLGVGCCPWTVLLGETIMDKFYRYSDSELLARGFRFSAPAPESIKAEPGKNLVFLFVESLENTMLDESLFPGLMPELKALSKEALVFDNMENGFNGDCTFPALYAATKGIPLSDEQLFRPNRGLCWCGYNDLYSHLISFPLILHKAGYRQVFLQGCSNAFSGTDLLLKQEKFDEMISLGDEKGTSGFDVPDEAVLTRAAETYERLAAGSEPFHLMTTTLNTHIPDGTVFPSSAEYEREGNPQVLNYLRAYRTADREIGKFVARLRKNPKWENTILVITGDHLLPPSSLLKTIPRDSRRRHFAIVLNAGRTGINSVPCAGFDWAPTIPALLGVRHNAVFPLGENLLQTPNPRRLELENTKTLLSWFLKRDSEIRGRTTTPSVEKTIRVRGLPDPAFLIGDREFRMFAEAKNVFPGNDEIITARLDFFMEPIDMERAKKISSNCRNPEPGRIFLLFGPASGPAGELFSPKERPADGKWILGILSGEYFYFSTADRPGELLFNFHKTQKENRIRIGKL